ncbi:MAG: hypothetical protein EBQ51_06695 [Verrucomicrobia bacterium]|nr:hypothetical protein [Verrucomicrobiota bacterium]NBS78553.1 hypothetical protein [bacterium]NBT24173.1 hypothetical protein [bacterium]NBV96779.1 hypothetical protein [Verrucomicrobiota bacterium]NBY66738.1 hypothetical protein [Verrucomicrobiota bacterium]
MLRVDSRVPRNASGGKTQGGKNTLQVGAGKPRIVARGEWRLGEEAGDPWAGAKAGRWLGEKGGALVRAGVRAWRESGAKGAEGRAVGILGVGGGGEWPVWLEGASAREVVEQWRKRSPLWLLEVLPNLPAAQLAAEIGARGPVETVREREGVKEDVRRRIQRWGRRGVKWVVVVCSTSTGAQAEVWGWEAEK